MSTTLRPTARMRPVAALRADPPRLGVEAKIDLCRGLFAVLVVVAHALEVTSGMDVGFEAEMRGAFMEILRHTLGTGFYWVMGFFVISGYCIQLSAERIGEGRAFPLRVYLAARLSRILPLYYIALAFAVAVEWGIAGARPSSWWNGRDAWALGMQCLGVQNLTQTFGSFAPSWSITNELIYYAMFGLLVAGFSGRTRRASWAGLALCAGVGVAMLALYRWSPGRGATLSLGLLFGLGINWFLGALVAAHRRELAASRLARAISRAWPLVLGAAIAARYDGRLRLEFVYLACGAAFTLMMIRFLVVDHDRGVSDGSIPGPVHALGLGSYAIYLFHGPVLMLAGSTLLRLRCVPSWPATWAILTAVAVATGFALGFALEVPLLSWRSRWLRQITTRDGARP